MLKKLNINTRTRKITFSDALIYKFKYAQKYNTQKNIINDYKKEHKIPLKYYDNIYIKVLNIFRKYSKKNSSYNRCY
jgi:hypothetical protein